jgi:hypothetical protein
LLHTRNVVLVQHSVRRCDFATDGDWSIRKEGTIPFVIYPAETKAQRPAERFPTSLPQRTAKEPSALAAEFTIVRLRTETACDKMIGGKKVIGRI